MKKLESTILLMSLPVWACCLCCDPDKPVDVGIVETAPCPEAAPPAWTQPAYVVTPSELELLQMIDAYDVTEMSKAEQEQWWKRYHELSDKASEERRQAAGQHPHTPP
jgi:hypothetical protein